VQALLNKHDILFWADEVITGFGRTGNAFGCDTMGIESPDMMTLAKQLSSAYMPISASYISGDLYEGMVYQSDKSCVFGHGYSYSSHPVACAVSLKVLEIYERDNIFAHAAKIGEYMQAEMQKFKHHPLVGEIRGKGMIGAIELVANKKTGQAFTDGSVGYFLTQACQDHGLIVRVVAGFSAAFCPPLIITKAQVDEIMIKFAKGLDDTLTYVVNKGLLVADQ
jgi:adenosylmethionine-8-amino-7-oxononanoate aminotransferase